MKIVTPTSYDSYDPDDPEEVPTRVHSSDLTPFIVREEETVRESLSIARHWSRTVFKLAISTISSNIS
ncbi:hypothetical protein Trydic_g16512 [Trypoxylus dichotomus]